MHAKFFFNFKFSHGFLLRKRHSVMSQYYARSRIFYNIKKIAWRFCPKHHVLNARIKPRLSGWNSRSFSHFGPKGLQPKGWFGQSSRVVAVQPCDPRHRDTAPRHARHSALASDSDAEIARFAACASRSASVSVTCIPFAFRIYFAPFLVASTKSFTLLQTSWNDFHISTTNKCGRKDIFATFIF